MIVQVQRYILRSFLLRDWSPAQLESQLSSDFVAHIFLPAVTRPSTLIKGGQALLDPAHPSPMCTNRNKQVWLFVIIMRASFAR